MDVQGLRDRVNQFVRPVARCPLSKEESQLYKIKGDDVGVSGLTPGHCDVDGIWPIYFWFEGYDRGMKRYLMSLANGLFYDEDFMRHKAYVSGYTIAYYGGWSSYCPEEFPNSWMQGFRDGDSAVKEKRRIFPWIIAFSSALYRSGWNIGRFGGDEQCAPIHYWGTRAYEQWFIGFEKGLGVRYLTLQKGDRLDEPRLWEPTGVMDDEFYETAE